MKNMFSSQQQRKEVSIIPLLTILYNSLMRLKSTASTPYSEDGELYTLGELNRLYQVFLLKKIA